jgi:prepilin-type processing-associated H-X9-DG protein
MLISSEKYKKMKKKKRKKKKVHKQYCNVLFFDKQPHAC